MLKKKSANADMGKWAEKNSTFDWQRMPDARAARGALAAQVADFEIFRAGKHGVIEVKEVQHDFRLPRTRIKQLPRIRKRMMAGGVGIILIYHSTTEQWRLPNMKAILGDRGASWDFSDEITYNSAAEALDNHPFFRHG